MFYYAQLNQDNICIGIALSTNIISQSDMILLDFNDEDKIYRKYESGAWSGEKYPDGYIKTVQDYYNDKTKELSTSRDSVIYGTFTYNEAIFDCDKEARDNINDLVFAYENDSTFAGRSWNTSGGLSFMFLTKDDIIPFKTAAVKVKDEAWGKFSTKMYQLNSINLEDPNVIDMINAIVW